MVNSHGDRFCPLSVGLWDPFQIAFFGLINGGDPNYLLTGMRIQVLEGIKQCKCMVILRTLTLKLYCLIWTAKIALIELGRKALQKKLASTIYNLMLF